MKKILIIAALAFTLVCAGSYGNKIKAQTVDTTETVGAQKVQTLINQAHNLGLPVQNITSLDSAVSDGIYIVKNLPAKGSTVGTYIMWALSIAGFLAGLISLILHYFKKKPS